MNRRATIFLAILALGLGTFVILQSSLRQDPGKPPGSALFDFEPDAVRSVIVTNGDAKLDFWRTENGWQINPAPVDRASAAAIRQILTLALDTRVLDRVKAVELADGKALSTYGLRKSRMRLDFKGDGDHALLFGKEASGEGRVYVRFENADDVYLIDDALYRAVFRPVGDFRDRRLSNLRPDRIESFVIRRPSGEIEIRRRAGGWHIVRPISVPADENAVTAFLNQVLGLEIQAFVEPGASGSVDQALDEPAASISLFAEGEAAPEVLKLGGQDAAGGVFARFSSRDVTVTLPQSAEKLLATELKTFRDPALARLNLDLVDRIRISAGATRFSVSRKAGSWEITDGEKIGRASEPAVERLADMLKTTRVERFESASPAKLAALGLDTPERRVDFLSVVSENTPESPAGEQSVLALAFGKPAADGLIPVHAADSPEIAFVPATVLVALPVEPASWVSP